MQQVATLFAPPWVDVLPSGERVEYGPRTPETYAKHVAAWKNWAFRLPGKDARRDADVMIAFVILEDGSYRAGIPSGELKVFEHVYRDGYSVRHAARTLGLSRETVRSYMRILKARVR